MNLRSDRVLGWNDEPPLGAGWPWRCCSVYVPALPSVAYTQAMMKTHGLFLFAACALSAANVAQAAGSNVVVYPEGVSTPVTLTLLARDGKVGRDNPFYDNYRPQVQFSATPQPVTCAVRVPQVLEKVEPGQTADLSMVCSEKFKSRSDEKSFVVFEGGRKVAVGTLK